MRNRPQIFHALALAVGIVAAVLRLVAAFFPFSVAVDLLLFGLLGALFAYIRPAHYWHWAILLSLPALLLAVLFLIRIGSAIAEGVGLYWLFSLVLIPGAALLGGYLGSRYRQRSQSPA